MCRGCGYCQTHGNLGKASVIIAQLYEITNYKFLTRLVSRLFYCLLELVCRGIPLEDTCILTVNPFCILIQRVSHIALNGSDSRDYMSLFQLADKVHTILNLFCSVLNLIVLNPRLVVLGLQIVNQENHAVVLAQSQGIIILVECLKCSTCIQQRLSIGRDCASNLIEGGLVPVEHTSCHSYRHCHQLAVCLTLLQSSFRELGQIQNISVLAQVCKVCSVVGISFNPVPVDLHYVSSISTQNI